MDRRSESWLHSIGGWLPRWQNTVNHDPEIRFKRNGDASVASAPAKFSTNTHSGDFDKIPRQAYSTPQVHKHTDFEQDCSDDEFHDSFEFHNDTQTPSHSQTQALPTPVDSLAQDIHKISGVGDYHTETNKRQMSGGDFDRGRKMNKTRHTTGYRYSPSPIKYTNPPDYHDILSSEPVGRTFKDTDYPQTLFSRDPKSQDSNRGKVSHESSRHDDRFGERHEKFGDRQDRYFDRHDFRHERPDDRQSSTHGSHDRYNNANIPQRAPQHCYTNRDMYQNVQQCKQQTVSPAKHSYTNSGNMYGSTKNHDRFSYNDFQKHERNVQQMSVTNSNRDRFSYANYAPHTGGVTNSNQHYSHTQTQESFDNQPPHQYRRKPKDPKPFDGSKIEWCDYLHHFLGVAEYNDWSEREMAKHLTMAFDGNALKYLSEFSEETLTNFNLLVQELFRKHDPAERAEAWKIEFKNRKIRTKETFSEYAQELNRLVKKAYPHMPSVARDQWILDSFTQGLQNIDMQKHIQFQHPKNVNEAISAAVEYDAFETSNLDKIKKPINAEVQSIQYKPYTNNTEMETLKNEMAEIKSLLKQNQNTSTNTENVNRNPHNYNSNYNSNYKTNQNGQNNGQKFDKKNAECYFCRKKGHLKDECRKLKAKIEREAQRVMNEPVPNSQGN